MQRVLLLILATLLLGGCSSHPLLRALSPSNIIDTVTTGSDTNAHVEIDARVPLIPQSRYSIEMRNGVTYVILQPPFNTAKMAQYYREELAKRRAKNFVVTTK